MMRGTSIQRVTMLTNAQKGCYGVWSGATLLEFWKLPTVRSG